MGAGASSHGERGGERIFLSVCEMGECLVFIVVGTLITVLEVT